MKITRIIQGKDYTFSLTTQELRESYEEQEHCYDCQDIINYLKSMSDAENAEFQKKYGISINDIVGNGELISRLATIKRQEVDDGVEWQDAVEYSITQLKDLI